MPRKDSQEAVKSAMEQLRKMYRIGQEAIALKESRQETYGKKLTGQLAEKHRISESDVFAARQFAERYTEDELEDLIRECQSAGFPMGKYHIAKLMTVKGKRERGRLQRKCIREGWRVKKLQTNLKGKYGKRSPGGAKFHPPKSVGDAKSQIAELCRRLLHFHEAMTSADPDSEEECGLTDLPDGLQTQLRETIPQVKKLAAECEIEG